MFHIANNPNNLKYVNLCMFRSRAIRCNWDFLDQDECTLEISPNQADNGEICQCGLELDSVRGEGRFRQSGFCERFKQDESQCLFFGCDWICV